ncbi:hypothetical protein [Streptomyces sp. NPDC014623]|uniref:hypothetical protein n=1 Tax=Streptomyces sp. NPDC014623 TaxID=3364875 RepID=UPI0036F77924
MSEDAHDVLGVTPEAGCLVVGAAVLVPAAVLMAVDVARGLGGHRLLVRWGAPGRGPEGDMLPHRPRVSLAWLPMSFTRCAAGLFGCAAVPATARADRRRTAWRPGRRGPGSSPG